MHALFIVTLHCYLLDISTDLTFQVYGSWILLQKDHKLKIKWVGYIYIHILDILDTDILDIYRYRYYIYIYILYIYIIHGIVLKFEASF